jgi:histidine ammonia-lyase
MMPKYFTLSKAPLSFKKISEILSEKQKLKLSDELIKDIMLCRSYLDDKMQNEEAPIYGINTGFGSLYNVKIEKENLQQLQENLVMSHACGIGEEVPQHLVKIMLLLKIKSLSFGHSGVQMATVNRLVDFFNHDIFPVIYTQGSLGASGDLAPLAHLTLPLIGKGEVWYEGQKMPTEILYQKMHWEPIQLQSKEGLALLNGTQFMSAYGVYLILQSFRLQYFADIIGTLSLEGFDGRIEPFHHLIHEVRPHKGQMKVAERVRNLLESSQIINQPKVHVQDPYSFRCIPQVHGATWDTLQFVAQTIYTEINSVTDNPNIFMEEDLIVSGGNFHGQPLALAFDFLGIAVAELGNISERRTYQLIGGNRGLPAYLVSNSGLNSGMMIPQYTAASIVSQNKQLATPASVDSIVSSNLQEDHVSMGANAATKGLRIVENVEKILAIELLNAAQAMQFRRPLKSSEFLESFLSAYRTEVPFMEQDEILHNAIVKSIDFLHQMDIDMDELFLS